MVMPRKPALRMVKGNHEGWIRVKESRPNARIGESSNMRRARRTRGVPWSAEKFVSSLKIRRGK